MKLKEVIFKKPVKVIQVFRKMHIYTKAERSFEDRKGKMEWADITSKAGYVSEGELFFPESIMDDPYFQQSSIITIEDGDALWPGYHVDEHIPHNRCLLLSHNKLQEIFEIRVKEQLELHLHYTISQVGLPKRGKFKLCELAKNIPVEIKINGKFPTYSDPYYKEQSYIIEYLGEYNRCSILRSPHPGIIKHIPLPQRTVDQLKPLW